MSETRVDETTVRQIMAAVDEMDADGFTSYFTEDGSFRYANAEPVVGRQAIGEAVEGFWSMIKGLRHDIIGIWTGEWEHGDVFSVEAVTVYTRKDDSTVGIPVTSTLRMEGNLVKDWRIFQDLAPLFAGDENT